MVSRLGERYPGALRLPATDDPEALLQLLQPYLDWQLAEIDTRSTDILICDLRTKDRIGDSPRLLLLSGEAVNVWLRQQGTHTT
jgi:hypothetical protein